MLEKRHAPDWADVIQNWTIQLSSPISDEDLAKHAKRTIRALGGMGSIGEIALADSEKVFTESVESLYRAAKDVLKCCKTS
jgi:hypothetical protein